MPFLVDSVRNLGIKISKPLRLVKKLYQDLIKSSLKRSGDTYDWKWQFVDDYVLCIWYHGRSTKFSLTVVKSLSATLFEKPHRNAIKKQTNKNTTEKSKREWSKRVNPPYMTLFPWKLFSIYSWFCVILRGYFKDATLLVG